MKQMRTGPPLAKPAKSFGVVAVFLAFIIYISLLVVNHITEKGQETPSFGDPAPIGHSDTTSKLWERLEAEPNEIPKPGATLPSCENQTEIRQVVFAKVHKAASSTVQNILLRFALARQLDLLMHSTRPCVNEFGKAIIPGTFIAHPLGKQFDILCHHVVYDAAEMDKYFPRSAVRVTILREPLQQALSALKYYATVYPRKSIIDGVQKHPTDPINGFLAHPEDFFPPNAICNEPGSYISNRMSYDLGLDHFVAAKNKATKVKQFLAQVEEQFRLVLIAEYFDESVVLLRRTLQWSTKDILFFKVNVAKTDHDSKWDHEPVLSPSLARKFRRCNNIDYELYEHFLPIFLEKIKQEPLFQEEVSLFREIQKDVEEFCVGNETIELFDVPESVWSNKFTISKSDCKLMSLSELEFTAMARAMQIKRFSKIAKRPL